MKKLNWIFLILIIANLTAFTQQSKFKLNDLGVFKKQGVDLLIYNDSYSTGGFYGSGSNHSIMDWSLTNAKLNQYFSDIISKEHAIRGLNYILGCHPASSKSFVAGVGVNSKKITYGSNIPGCFNRPYSSETKNRIFSNMSFNKQTYTYLLTN